MNSTPKLWRITIDTNPEDCNYHCIMCEEHSKYSNALQTIGKHRRMPIEWIDKIFEEASLLGVSEIIPSTMGEPLLYKGIDRFFDLAQKYGIKLNITTNGSFPNKPIQEWAKLIIPNTTDIKISINGATAKTSESIMEGSHFNTTIENIKTLAAYRNNYYAKTGIYCSITLQLTFMQNNMHELTDIVKMAADLDIDRIKGHHLWSHFKEIEYLSMKANRENIILWNQYVQQAIVAQSQYKRKNGKQVVLENIIPIKKELGDIVPQDSKCPFLGRELWISAEGNISPCCAPDNLRKQLGDFGNIQHTTLSKVLDSNDYRQLVQNYKQIPLCNTCNMRR